MTKAESSQDGSAFLFGLSLTVKFYDALIKLVSIMSKDEVQNSIVESIKERMSSPFLSSIFLSWPLINYRLILVLVTDGPYDQKLKFIDENLYGQSWNGLYCHMFIWPIVVGLVYTLIYPRVDTFLSVLFKELQNTKLEKMFKVDRVKPIDQKFQAQYFLEWDDKVQQYKNLLDQANRDFQELRGRAENENKRLLERYKKLTRMRIMYECEGGSEFMKFMEIPTHERTWMIPGQEGVFKKHPLFANFKKLIDFVLSQVDQVGYVGGKYVDIGYEQILDLTGVDLDSEEFYLDFLYCFGAIRVPVAGARYIQVVNDHQLILNNCAGFF